MTQKGVDEAGGAPSAMQGLVPTDEGAVLEYHGARRPDAFSEDAGVRALQIFAANPDDEEGVMELARMMDFEARDEAVVHNRNLLLAGGLLAAHADSDDELADDEREHLVELILPFSDDPEELLQSVGTIDQAGDLFTASATWIRKNVGPERYELMDKLISVVFCDDKAHEGEVQFLKQAATELEIPFSWVEKKLAGHSERAAREMGAPRTFGLRK